jgi:hypothetical protein
MKKFIVALFTVLAFAGTAVAAEQVTVKPVQAQTTSVKKVQKTNAVKKAKKNVKAKTAKPVQKQVSSVKVAPVKLQVTQPDTKVLDVKSANKPKTK